jgi:hypothetical protein
MMRKAVLFGRFQMMHCSPRAALRELILPIAAVEEGFGKKLAEKMLWKSGRGGNW